MSLYLLPDDMQWLIWRHYHSKYVLAELREDAARRDATTIQTFVKEYIMELLADIHV